MRIITTNIVHKERWDRYVSSHSCSSPYHYFAWGEACEKSYGHRLHYLHAEHDGKIIGVLPLVFMKPPLSGGGLISLPFCDVAGPLCDSSDIHQALVSQALSDASSFGVKVLELRYRGGVDSVLDAVKLESGKVSMILDLPDSSDKLLKSFKSKLRSQINKAKKNGLVFKWLPPGILDDFFYVFSRNMRSLGSPTHSIEWFTSLSHLYDNRIKIGVVYLNDNPVGAGIILLGERGVSIPWASTLREYNHLSPNMLLYWSVLAFSSDAGYQSFDFGRSTLGEGTFKFKQQWGAKPVELNWYRLSPDSSPIIPESMNSKSKDYFIKAWRRLPLGLTILLGPKIRKYISL